MQLNLKRHHGFLAWLARCGAEVLVPDDGSLALVVVRGQTLRVTEVGGMQIWPEPLPDLYITYVERRVWPQLAAQPTKMLDCNRRRARIMALAKRDGWACWYCCRKLRPTWLEGERETATLEELCPRQYGGPNHLANQALACSTCNHRAANLTVVEKVAMRESYRKTRPETAVALAAKAEPSQVVIRGPEMECLDRPDY